MSDTLRDQIESFNRTLNQADWEVLDPESIKRRLERSRNAIKNQGVQSFAPVNKETKALTTVKSHSLSHYQKAVVYCPACIVQAPASRMDAYEVKWLLEKGALAAYEELVGGLAVQDESVFFHCRRCNYKMLAEIDEAKKLDAITPEEYVIESVNDPQRMNKKPVLTGQSKRFNRYKDRKKKEIAKRVQEAKEKMDREALQGREVKPE